jgi:hypothetical protein
VHAHVPRGMFWVYIKEYDGRLASTSSSSIYYLYKIIIICYVPCESMYHLIIAPVNPDVF